MDHDAGDETHALLQHAIVVEDGEERRNKQNRRQGLEDEGKEKVSAKNSRQVIGPRQVSEDELGPLVGKADEGFEQFANVLDSTADGVFPAGDFDAPLEDQEGQEQLQAESPADRPPVNDPQVGGKEGDEAEEKEDSCEGLSAGADRCS